MSMLNDEVDMCTKKLIFNTPRDQRCAFVNAHCQDKYEFNDYYGWFFCSFDQDWIIISLICLSALFVQIRLLEYTSDGYISQAIGKIAGYLKLTEAMAGATLLAFSNGATDVITTLVASGSGDGDDLAVGALFGASTFAVTIILAYVIWARPGNIIKDLKRGNLVRDIITYLVAITIFVTFGFYKSNYWIIGTILILIYLVYVFIVWMEERGKESTIGKTNEMYEVLRKTIAAHGTIALTDDQALKSALEGPSETKTSDQKAPEIVINSATDTNMTNFTDSLTPSMETTGAMTLGTETEEVQLKRISEENPMTGGNTNQLTVPLTQNLEDEAGKVPSINTAKSSFMGEGEILEKDLLKAESKGHIGKIPYKLKRRAKVKWE